MKRYKVVIFHTSTITYRQVEYLFAKSEDDAEEYALERDLVFDDPINSELENVEVYSITEEN